MPPMKASERAPSESARYGFGTENMKRLKVCPRCGRVALASAYICPQCGRRLPQQNLFQLYQLRHRLCPVCDTVLSARMRYCPHCGARQQDY